MMSDSFMTRSSWLSILTSVPDHLPKQHSVVDHEINRYELAGLIAAARPDDNDLAL